MINWIKSNPITFAVLAIIFASFVYQASFRNRHFQECDSAGVYDLLYTFPQSGLTFYAIAYPNGSGVISKQQAEKILESKYLQTIVEPILKKYPKEFIVSRLANTGPVQAFRFALISAISSLHLPHFLQSLFALPLSSTYPMASGLLYGLISGPRTDYADFMSRVLFLNILVFHLSVILLYYAGRKLNISEFASGISALLMLFSISLYSSGFSAGSPVWMIFGSMAWLYILVKNISSPNLEKNISLASAVLIFFNYLVGLFWIAFIVSLFLKTPRPKFLEVIKKQKWALIAFVICGILFYPPGQGVRSVLSVGTFFSDFYYTILNFFSWYNQSPQIDMLQFILGLGFLAGIFWLLIKQAKKHAPFETVMGLIFIIYLILVMVKLLGFGPIRQMAFLAPPIFLGLSLLFGHISTRPKHIRHGMALKFLALFGLTVLGFAAVRARHAQTTDITPQIVVEKDIEQIGIHDCSVNWIHTNWNSNASVDFINPKQFEPGKTFLYLSQTIPFDTAMVEWQKKWDIDFTLQSSKKIITEAYFMAYNPNFSRFNFTRPNNAHMAKFIINSVQPK